MVCRREVRLDVHASLWEDILTTGLNVAQAGGDLLGELLYSLSCRTDSCNTQRNAVLGRAGRLTSVISGS